MIVPLYPIEIRAGIDRLDRRERWNQAVKDTSTAWRESFSYKHGPIMDHRMVKREVHAMLAKVIDGRLMVLFAPIFAFADSIDRSLVVIKILASPSGNGPERYAPKDDGRGRIKVR